MARKKAQTVQLKVRMKEPLRASIEKAAKVRGVSMNREIVDRVERSFRDEVALYREFGGEDGYNFARLFAAFLRWAQHVTGRSWLKDPEPFLVAVEAMRAVRVKGMSARDIPDNEYLRMIGDEIISAVFPKRPKHGRKGN